MYCKLYFNYQDIESPKSFAPLYVSLLLSVVFASFVGCYTFLKCRIREYANTTSQSPPYLRNVFILKPWEKERKREIIDSSVERVASNKRRWVLPIYINGPVSKGPACVLPYGSRRLKSRTVKLCPLNRIFYLVNLPDNASRTFFIQKRLQIYSYSHYDKLNLYIKLCAVSLNICGIPNWLEGKRKTFFYERDDASYCYFC